MADVILENLTKRFRNPTGQIITALEGLTLAVSEGELLVIVGPSGSGKTTTLRLLAGLEPVTNGTIRIGGRDMAGVEPRQRDVAMVFQNQALYPHMSVYENLAFGLELRKVPRTEIEHRVKEAAETLNLADCLERKPEALSGGQRQRVALGRALVRKPGLFLFDEPLSNLDPPLRLQMRAEIARLHSRLGATMIYVTHDQGEAMALADRIAVLNAGLLQQVAAPLALYSRPANLFVAGFIGSPPMNFFHGRMLRNESAVVFRVAAPSTVGAAANALTIKFNPAVSAELQSLLDRPLVLGLRPEHFEWTGNLAPGEASLEVVPDIVEHLGPQTLVYLTCAGHSFIALAPADAEIVVNRKTPVRVNLRNARFFDAETGRAVGMTNDKYRMSNDE